MYTRVSTGQQVENGRSLEAQVIECREWADRHAHVVVAELSDPGVSGSSIRRRHGLREALRLLEAGEADTLIVKSMSRLTRKLADWIVVAEAAVTQGWNLVVLDQGVDLRTASGRMVANVVAVVGEWQREMTAEQTASTFRTLGIRTGPAVTAYTPEQQAEVVALRAVGLSLGKIADRVGLKRYVVQRIVDRGTAARFTTGVMIRRSEA